MNISLNMIPKNFPRKRRQAFSLVEITLAIGILSFCMISIMGVVPVALNVSRKSIEKNVETRILQNVRAELLQVPFSELPANGTFVFDTDGYRLDGAAASGAARFYDAEYTRLSHVSLPASQQNSKVATCKVAIRNTIRDEVTNHAIHLPDNGF